nr:HD domain-containing protein [Lachnospiraceae bacterium]
KIRELSSPPLYDFDDAGDYSERLKHNFETIGKLAEENRRMLEEILYPLLEQETNLSEEAEEEMADLCEKLLCFAEKDTDFENLDLPIMDLVSEKLVQNAEDTGSLEKMIICMDGAILASYSMMNMTERIISDASISNKYKKRGLEIGGFFRGLLEKEKFLSIPDEKLREIVLTNARFSVCMYERFTDYGENEEYLTRLEALLRLFEDPVYHEAVPDYDWKYYKYRVYEYILQSTDIGNIRHFSKEQIGRIVKVADLAEEMIASDPEYYNSITGNNGMPVFCARNRYLAGNISEEKYLEILTGIYENRDRADFSGGGNYTNLIIPLEIILVFKTRRLKASDQRLVKKLYQNISEYMFHMPNAGALSFAMEYFSEVVHNFIEIPGGITFEDFALQSLAALHPPTYIHSQMVGQISTCLCSYLIDMKPDLLAGVLGCKNADEVKKNREGILAYTYHAAICHDFGKIPIIDTIFVYGRKLLDDEFSIIKTHPKMGYEMLSKYESTRAYAEVALGHHRFYDDSKGYPSEFSTSNSPVKPIIDIVLCADCMDAATDSVGRSYNKGKTIDDYVREVREGSGTRYAPWLSELFENEEVRNDMDYLLNTGREETYRDTYNLLKIVKENGD